MTSVTKWGWVNVKGDVQDQVFDTPDAAVKEMQSRLGEDYDIERITELGFKLAVVKVQIRILYTLGSPSKS